MQRSGAGPASVSYEGEKDREELMRGREAAKQTRAKLREIKKREKGKRSKKGKKGGKEKDPAGVKTVSDETTAPVQKYHRGFLSAIMWWVLMLPILLVPIIGFILAFTLVPFVAGRRGSRWVEKRYAVEIAFLVSSIVTFLHIVVLYAGLHFITHGTLTEVTTGFKEYLIITAGAICNLVFCMLGAASGKVKNFETQGETTA